MFMLTSTAPCLQIGPISSPSLTHIPHPPAPVPPQLVVSSKAGGERAQFLVQVARRVTHSDWGRTSSFAPLLLLNVSLILSSSLCQSQLGEYKTFEGKRKSLFPLSSLAKHVKMTYRAPLSRCAVSHFPANPLYIRWCCFFCTISREPCCDRM